MRNEAQEHYAQDGQNADESIGQFVILLPLEVGEDDHSDDNDNEEHCDDHDVRIAAVFAHPLHEDRAAVLVGIGVGYVKLVVAFFTFDGGEVNLVVLPQSSLYYPLYVQQQAPLVVSGGALAWVDEGRTGPRADPAGVVAVQLVVEDYFGLLDLEMVRLLELSPFSTHRIKQQQQQNKLMQGASQIIQPKRGEQLGRDGKHREYKVIKHFWTDTSDSCQQCCISIIGNVFAGLCFFTIWRKFCSFLLCRTNQLICRFCNSTRVYRTFITAIFGGFYIGAFWIRVIVFFVSRVGFVGQAGTITRLRSKGQTGGGSGLFTEIMILRIVRNI